MVADGQYPQSKVVCAQTLVSYNSTKSRSFALGAEWTTRGTAPPLSSIAGSSIEQRVYKKVHWKERRLNTVAESSRWVPVMSVLILEMKGTSVGFIRISTVRVCSQSVVAATSRSFIAE